MPGAMHLSLLAAVACFCLLQTQAYTRKSSVTLPNQRTNAEYVTKCDFDNDLTPFCDWTSEGLIRTQTGAEEYYLSQDEGLVSPSGVARLESDYLYISGESCLEFWYHTPDQNSTELKVLLRDYAGESLLWASQSTDSNSWKQVFIPLVKSEDINVQVIFEVAQGLHEDGEIAIDRVGVRRGQCGQQCQAGTDFWTDESTHCTCRDGQLSCAQTSCPEGQTCRQIARSHDPAPHGTCTVHSDPHYSTFDGVSFRFVGPCTYVLAKVCEDSGRLPVFSVEAKNEQLGNSSVSSVQQVNVNLQGLWVSMLKRENSRVMVNGIWQNLPLSLNGNNITINRNGAAVVLETNFQLSVSYALTGAVQVTVPSQYSDRLCGMCGNFNHVMEDDFQTPDGAVANDARTFGQSWQSADAPCETPVLPSLCAEQEELEYANETYCGVILSRHGPFAACSSALSTDSFFRSCVFNMCTTHGDPEALCDVLQAFAKMCRKAGIIIPAWRSSSSCPLVCGENSHYNACSSDCPETCTSLDAPAACGSCEERCECEPGFQLSGGKCVPAVNCGCWVDSEHYEKGATFMDGKCERLCQCMGQGNIQCSVTSCPADEVCKVKDGVMGCFSSSSVTCRVYGDPHYITFDGKAYTFHGSCNYTLAKTCSGHSPVQFEVTARNEMRVNTSLATLNSVALEVQGLHIAMRKDKSVYVNGGLVTLPLNLSSSVKVVLKGPYIQVDTAFGLRILFDGDNRLFVQVDERYRGEMCGLCGTYSDNQFDDFVTPDGDKVASPHEFASSWRVIDNHWSCSPGSDTVPVCRPELENEAYGECSKLLEDPFKACHWFVSPDLYIASCVYDHCATEGDMYQLCTSLENYAAACEVAEVSLGDWWHDSVCAGFPSTPPPTGTTHSPARCPLDCNFDHDECGWQQLIQDSFDWTRMSASTPSDQTGPNNDHTTGGGSYMYIEGDGVYHGDSARMLSPKCQVSGTHCVRFWYHQYGTAIAMTLNIYQLQGNTVTKIWSKVNNQGDVWKQAEIEINVTGPFRIIVEGIRGSDSRSDVAWDDVSIRFATCEGSSTDLVTTISPPPINSGGSLIPHPVCNLDCNFDSNLCAWSQMMTDSFDWTWQSGSTPSMMTGPSSDHTRGSGHYLYIEGNGVYNGDTARLLSTECPDTGAQCLQFWYHMHGTADTMGLSVYLLEVGYGQHQVWMRRNDRGDMWHRAQVDLHVSRTFKIIFEGRRGTTELSDVAIDDVSLHRGRCSDLIDGVTTRPPMPPTVNTTVVLPTVDHSTPPTTLPTTTPKPIETTTPSGDVNSTLAPDAQTTLPSTDEGLIEPHPVCNLGCNFDNNFCGWNQLLTDVFDWTRQSGSTPTQLTGPSFDHTSGSGHYLYIEGNGVHNGDTARLLSPACPDPHPQCLQFWYHMHGTADTMGLNVYLLEGRRAQKVWSKRNDRGNMWHRAQVDLSPGEAFKIIFEGRRGTTELSDVAIDDVSLHRGRCSDLIDGVTTRPPMPPTVNTTVVLPTVDHSTPPTTTPNTTPKPIETTTPSGDVNSTLAPDAQTTLPSTDEGLIEPHPVCNLGCNFDNNFCGWNQLLTDVFDWTRQSGSTPTQLTGPSFDHTSGSGHYLYIEGNGVHNGDTARLLSPACPDPHPQCLQFWYHMHGTADTMGLNVYLLEGRWAQEVWSKRNDRGNMWHRAQVDLSPSEAFQIFFEGRRGTSELSDVAIDDVSLYRSPCSDLNNPGTPAPTSGGSTDIPVPPPVNNTTTPQPPTTRPDTPAPTTAAPNTPAPTTTRPTTARPSPTTPMPTPSCPRNSHYTDCILACQPTCKQLHGPPQCDADEPCVEGCVCDEGFVLKQRVCVPIRQCGCQDNNGNNHYFDEVWYSDHCTQRCQCEEDDGEGEIECGDSECDGDSICHMSEDGEFRCKSTGFSECTIEDDPEYRTFDNMKHDFEGKESYVLVQTTGLPKNLPDVYVEGINKIVHDEEGSDENSSEEHSSEEHSSEEHSSEERSSEERSSEEHSSKEHSSEEDDDGDSRGRDDEDEDDDDSEENHSRGCLREIKVRVYNHTVVFKKDRKVILDGARTRPPVYPAKGLKILERSSRVYLETDFGFSLEFNGRGKAEIILPHTYNRKVGGLCGNFDGKGKNDMMKPDGSQAKSVKEFGESWKVTEDKLRIRGKRSSDCAACPKPESS